MNTQDETPDRRARMIQLIVADLLGEADAAERAEVARALAADPDLALERERLSATIGMVRGLASDAPAETLSPAATASLGAAAAGRTSRGAVLPGPGAERRGWTRGTVFRAAAAVIVALGAFALWQGSRGDGRASRRWVANLERERAQGAQHSESPAEARATGAAEAKDDLYDGESGRAKSRQMDTRENELGLRVKEEGEPMSAELMAPVPDALYHVGQVPTPAITATDLNRFAQGLTDGPASEPSRSPPTSLGQNDLEALRKLGYVDASSAPVLQESRSGAAGGAKGSYRGPGDSVAPGAPATPGPATLGVPVASGTGQGAGGVFTGRYGGKRAAGVEPALPARVASGSDEYFFGPPESASEADRFSDAVSTDAEAWDYDKLDQLRGLGYLGSPADGDEQAEEGARAELRELGYGGHDGVRLRFDGGEAALTPEQRRASIEALLISCRRRPQEQPRDMFYRWWGDNPFELARHDSLSTFAVDVDTASYTLARRYLVDGRLPTKAQIRTEEFVNYFKGDVPAPSEDTFAVATELAPSLFNAAPDTWMLRVALRGREVARAERKPLALTFVVDVSGSMKEQNRLELVKHALRLLVGELDANDSVALVAFSNEARLVLPMTSARNRGLIESAIHPLSPQGGTNVQAGLRMGYEAALAGFAAEGHNRVVFLSDGVGNIGQTDAAALNDEVQRARERGVWLNTIGVGMNNHNDAFLEQLADKGDGICNYVDDEREARRALVENFTGAFEPIARNVKIQVEFDPAQVARYRLLGYENRAVADRDFRNDAVDAGEVGSGHQVVALYELVRSGNGDGDAPLATVRVRWLPPQTGQRSADPLEAPAAREAAWTVRAGDAAGSYAATSAGYRRSVLVGQLAEVLRRSIHARDDSLESLLTQSRELAPALNDPDFDEFVKMVERTIELIAPEWTRYDTLARRLDDLRRVHYRRAQLEDNAVDPGSERFEKLDGRARQLEDEIRREFDGDSAGQRIRTLGYTDER